MRKPALGRARVWGMDIVVMVETGSGSVERTYTGADYVSAKAAAEASLVEGERLLWIKTDRA